MDERLIDYWWMWVLQALFILLIPFIVIGGMYLYDRIVCGINEPEHKHK